jgi:hypothetical protein
VSVESVGDPPPLKWSDSEYGFWPEDDQEWEGSDTSQHLGGQDVRKKSLGLIAVLMICLGTLTSEGHAAALWDQVESTGHCVWIDGLRDAWPCRGLWSGICYAAGDSIFEKLAECRDTPGPAGRDDHTTRPVLCPRRSAP